MVRSKTLAETAATAPTLFRLPGVGKSDPYFSVGRQTYTRLEEDGCIKLVRMLRPGKKRPSVFVDYAEMLAYLRGCAVKGAE
jgi:hypothetical protein